MERGRCGERHPEGTLGKLFRWDITKREQPGPEISQRPGGLLNAVRLACRHVAEKARFVHVNSEFILTYAATLPLETLVRPAHDPATHYLGHGEDTLAFFITLDSINFGSGYFPHLRKRPGMSGYFTIASSLNDHFLQNGPFSAEALTEVSTEECTRIFGQDPDNKEIQRLMQHFARALNDLGHYLQGSMDGSFLRLVESANHSAETLALFLVTNMPYFQDIVPYAGVWVPFLKRAQLTAADLAIAFEGQGPGRFDDLNHLTIFADNLVPHVLRMDGVLIYDDELLRQINEEWDIGSGSAEEVEIRACALHAVELIVQELRKQGRAVNAMQLDYLLWNRGQLPRYKAHPRHRAQSVYY